ncbi:maltose acetyltransferase [Photobacterium leiognathi subsp. mandapamensis]|nr:acyltransferase [Photobacterium leiognathi]PSU95987.1 maltose acetyltransferase [Photobacterium leiognathi subsp. mandapamensis]
MINKIFKKIKYIKMKSRLSNDSEDFKLFGSVTIEVPKNVCISEGCTLNEGVYISGHDKVFIDKFVSLSAGCKIITAYLEPNELETKSIKNIHKSKPVSIGRNSQIGAGAIILPGVIIGKNTIIGAGSVVTKDVPDNTIFAGNPAKLIRKIC